MKISEVKELLNQEVISEEMLNELKKDERTGVQKLLLSYAKKQEKKLFYIIACITIFFFSLAFAGTFFRDEI